MAKRTVNKTEISSEKMSKISANSEQITDMIRKKAYELYEKKGKKSGRDMDNWLEAERVIKQKML